MPPRRGGRTDRAAIPARWSRAPPGEGVEQLDPGPLRLLRVKLRPDHVRLPHEGGEDFAVLAGAEHVRVGDIRRVVAVHVIEEPRAVAEQWGEQGVAPA